MNKILSLGQIRKYTQIPFKDCGRSFEGCDCGGLVWLIYKNELKIELPKWNDLYNSTHRTNALVMEDVAISMLGALCNEVSTDNLQPFDVLLFRMGGANTHVGLVIDKTTFIHIMKGMNNVSCEKIHGIKWKNRIAGVFRYEKKEQ